ncbi:MAG: ROK family protein [Acidobacteria bacterium]|nr:ROK family protein [Acidobacteriota bacterium]
MAAKKSNQSRPHPKVKPIGPFTLALDIGGTGLKAAILDVKGNMVTDRLRILTPEHCPPRLMLSKLKELVAMLPPTAPAYNRISVGFPGVVREGRIYTAHNLGTQPWIKFDLATALQKQFGKPCRVLNDADLQGLAAVGKYGGKGVEMVITLGTGVGSSLFENGRLLPHMEFAHHPLRNGQTYEEQLGDVTLKEVGKKRWSKRVRIAIQTLRDLINFDHLYIGGGNAEKIKFKLPPDVSIIPNTLGMIGGIYLWRD